MPAECSYGAKGWANHPRCKRRPRWKITFIGCAGYYCEQHAKLVRSTYYVHRETSYRGREVRK